MNLFAIAPTLIPLFAAALMQLWPSRFVRPLGALSLFFSTLLLISSALLWNSVWQNGTQVIHLGNWPAPFGIVFVADLLGSTMSLITAFVGFCFSLFVLKESMQSRSERGYLTAASALIAGVNGSFLSGDLFNLFVWFEVMLMSSFVLIAYEGRTAQLQGALKYTVMNLVGSFLFLIAIGIIYGSTGTLNMAELSMRISNSQDLLLPHLALSFLLIAFGLKAGVFPLYWWLPASYPTPRIGTSALLAGLLTKVGVYALLRTLTLIYPHTLTTIQPILLSVAVLTMVTGVLGAASQMDIRRILSFHIISQIGYMVLGIALFTQAAIAATVFFVIHNIIAKTSLFFVGGIVDHLRGTTDLRKFGSLLQDFPLLAVLFLIPALSLAGIPPLTGFFAKFAIIQSGFASEAYISVAAALIVSLLTLYSMMKIWMEGFWKEDPNGNAGSSHLQRMPVQALIPVALMALATLTFGFWPDLLFQPAIRIAHELMNPNLYVDAVMRGGR